MQKEKVYKCASILSSSMLPGDPKGSPDESLILLDLGMGGIDGRNSNIY